jgi:hypothetical protein
MRMRWLLCVVLGTLAWGQTPPSASPSPQAAPGPAQSGAKMPAPTDSSASVSPTAPVLTINGVCPAPTGTTAAKTDAAKSAAAKPTATAKSSADCKTVITKADFEKLADALSPNVTPQLRRQLAGLLPRLYALSDAAKKQGLDKTPEFAESVKFVRMQVLANELQRKIQKEAADVPQSEIEKYYKDNPQAYEQYSLDRIFVPRNKQSENEAKEEEEKDEKLSDDEKKAKQATDKAKADETEQTMTKLAESLHGRAAAGEDFTKLQKESYDAAGMKVEAPNVNLPNVRRTGLPPAHAAVLDLKPGEVSQVISDTGGHYIYKMVSKTILPLDQVKNEIHGKLQNDRMRERMDKLNNSFKAETNEAYFGPAGPGPMAPPHPRPGLSSPQSTHPQPPSAQAPPNTPN